MQLGITYIPVPVAGDGLLASSASLGPGSLYARFEERGWPIEKIREEVTARMPTPPEAALLNLPEGVPLLEVLHTGMTGDDVPFEVTRFLMRSDYNGLDYTMMVEE